MWPLKIYHRCFWNAVFFVLKGYLRNKIIQNNDSLSQETSKIEFIRMVHSMDSIHQGSLCHVSHIIWAISFHGPLFVNLFGFEVVQNMVKQLFWEFKLIPGLRFLWLEFGDWSYSFKCAECPKNLIIAI